MEQKRKTNHGIRPNAKDGRLCNACLCIIHNKSFNFALLHRGTLIKPQKMCSVGRERQEREEAEREGRQIQEEEPEEENMHSPFQPISNVISVVRETFLNLVVNCSPKKP